MRNRSVLVSAIALLLSGLCGGCPERDIGAVEVEPSSVERVELPSETNAEIDLLFVIDNSVSMEEEQNSLIENFGKFIEVLKNAEGGLPSLHIGVVTSDMGTMGGTRYTSIDPRGGSCTGLGEEGALRISTGFSTARYLESLRPTTPGGTRPSNHTGELKAAFAAAATVGSRGCNFESHLMSMKRALDGNRLNEGFLRPHAYLAVVFIADEDDCSVDEAGQGFFNQPDLQRNSSSFICFRNSTVCDGPADPFALGPRTSCRPREDSPFSAKVSSMVTFLKSIKPEPQLIVAGIYGQLDSIVEVQRLDGGSFDVAASCKYPSQMPTQHARPPVRLDAFVRQFRNHLSTTICGGDLAGPMDQIAKLVTGVTGTRCFQGKLAEPRYCSVADVTDPFGPDRHATTIPQCDAAHSRQPCWSLGEDRDACPTTETHLAISIDRGSTLPPSNSRVVADCVTE